MDLLSRDIAIFKEQMVAMLRALDAKVDQETQEIDSTIADLRSEVRHETTQIDKAVHRGSAEP